MQGVEDHLLAGGHEAGAVGIFDAQNELAFALAGVDVVDEADVGGADVRVAGGRGSNADTDGGKAGCGWVLICHDGQPLMLAGESSIPVHVK